MDVVVADYVRTGVDHVGHASIYGSPMFGIKAEVLHNKLSEAQVVLVGLANHKLDILNHLVRPTLLAKVAAKRVCVVLKHLLKPGAEILSQQLQPWGYNLVQYRMSLCSF